MLIEVPQTREHKVHIGHLMAFVLVSFLPFLVSATDIENNKKYFIDENSSYYVNLETWIDAPNGGDTIFISSERTKPLRFQFITGEQDNPVVIINTGGQVDISSETTWGAMVFENCRYIKLTGEGHEHYKYGFKLAAESCGLAFVELSSDCEAAFVKISHDGFFGIMAKKDYGGYPPSPIPVFSNLHIHDCFVENVVEGMYLGETKSPGMEFKHVRIYNNIVRNTGRESMQIANMVEDVEIYNNTLLDAGRTNEDQQNNLLQIGDNSVAKVYNNIMMGAPGCGLISFGMGDNIYTNNYLSTCKGIFLDERKSTNAETPIEIKGNYFTNNIDRGWVIRNMNQYNPLLIADNLWDADFDFYLNDSGNDENYTLSNNTHTEIAPVLFTNVAENDYSLSLGNPAAYANLGAPGGPEFFGVINDPAIDEPVAEQIVLNADMIVDEVTGGSLWPATYLVDEQTLTPETGEHPISQSWKPYWNMNNGPYHIYIDLGAEYFLTTIALHDMHDTKNLEVSIGEPGNWQPLFTESCDKYKTWKEHDVSVATQYVRLSMTESVFAAVNELVLYGYRITQPESVQIALNAEMMVDEVEGGSYWSADYLVDEQNLTPETEEHPTSQSWKPFWNMDKGPYHVYIDLGKEYTITEIALHDMHNTKNLDVSVGEPGNWDVLFTESCDKYISWKQHETNVKTRYVRLSMNESVFAAVNEIVLYGYSDEGEIIAEKSAGINSVINTETVTSIADVIESSLQDLFIRQNPVRNSLKLNVPDLLSTNFTIEIFSLNGARLFSQNYTYSPTAQLSIDISESCIKNGVYLMRYLNESGTTKCLKFVKNDY
jgi:hypothetical protein